MSPFIYLSTWSALFCQGYLVRASKNFFVGYIDGKYEHIILLQKKTKGFFIKMTFNCHEGKLIYVIASSSETFKHQTLVQEVLYGDDW